MQAQSAYGRKASIEPKSLILRGTGHSAHDLQGSMVAEELFKDIVPLGVWGCGRPKVAKSFDLQKAHSSVSSVRLQIYQMMHIPGMLVIQCEDCCERHGSGSLLALTSTKKRLQNMGMEIGKTKAKWNLFGKPLGSFNIHAQQGLQNLSIDAWNQRTCHAQSHSLAGNAAKPLDVRHS